MDSSLMHKDVFRAIFRDDESETLLDVEPLDSSRLGGEVSQVVELAAVSNNKALSRLGEC